MLIFVACIFSITLVYWGIFFGHNLLLFIANAFCFLEIPIVHSVLKDKGKKIVIYLVLLSLLLSLFSLPPLAICHQVLDVYSEEEKEQEAAKAKESETNGKPLDVKPCIEMQRKA